MATVQILIAAHIAMWLLSQKYGWFGGVTLTPIEPSESMEFSKHGVINAGLIFFAIALLATLILGRWFCGWGCHVVMLQDLCGWMMKKIGIRPKPFRSRLLIYVPLLLALYMFILPMVHRWLLLPMDGSLVARFGADNWLVQTIRFSSGALGFPIPVQLPDWQLVNRLTTEGFWDTFVGPILAVPFLFICGFATVYFLGAKGFCTYGCPYGGFFAPIDKYAPGRIRVTNDCEQCGHCTAVCTSNVRVHEEVREYGMVVDPGCMKCLDCVSVCPNDALYFGFGKPAAMKGAPKHEAPKRRFDMTWPEEVGFALFFLGSFLAVRGIYGLVPMLMAVGIAGVATFLAWKLWRMLCDKNVNLHRYRLKSNGSMTRSGWIASVIAGLCVALVAHSGVVQIVFRLADHYATTAERLAVDGAATHGEIEVKVDTAIGLYKRASFIGDGGIALVSSHWQTGINFRLAYMYAVKGDVQRSLSIVREMTQDDRLPNNTATLAWSAQLLLESDEFALAQQVLEHSIEVEPRHGGTYSQLAGVKIMLNRIEEAEQILRDGLEVLPNDPLLNIRMAELLQYTGRTDEAQQYIERTQSSSSSSGQ